MELFCSQAALDPYLSNTGPLGRDGMLLSLARCTDLLQQPSQLLVSRAEALQQLAQCNKEQLVGLMGKASYMLQHDPADLEAKVRAEVSAEYQLSSSRNQLSSSRRSAL